MKFSFHKIFNDIVERREVFNVQVFRHFLGLLEDMVFLQMMREGWKIGYVVTAKGGHEVDSHAGHSVDKKKRLRSDNDLCRAPQSQNASSAQEHPEFPLRTRHLLRDKTTFHDIF